MAQRPRPKPGKEIPGFILSAFPQFEQFGRVLQRALLYNDWDVRCQGHPKLGCSRRNGKQIYGRGCGHLFCPACWLENMVRYHAVCAAEPDGTFLVRSTHGADIGPGCEYPLDDTIRARFTRRQGWFVECGWSLNVRHDPLSIRTLCLDNLIVSAVGLFRPIKDWEPQQDIIRVGGEMIGHVETEELNGFGAWERLKELLPPPTWLLPLTLEGLRLAEEEIYDACPGFKNTRHFKSGFRHAPGKN